MLQGFKRTIANLFNENKKVFYVIGGAVLLPLAMIAVVGIVFAIGALLLFLGLNVYQAIVLMVLMGIGAGTGYLVYKTVEGE